MTPLDWTVLAAGAGGVLVVLWYFFPAERARAPQPGAAGSLASPLAASRPAASPDPAPARAERSV